MGRFNKYEKKSQLRDRPWTIHPVWRGIGCLLLLIVPIVAYAGATMLVEANLKQGWFPVPFELAQTAQLPLLGAIPHLYANLLLAAVLSLMGFGLVMIFYAIFYAAVGPSRFGPLDAPPIRRASRRRRG